MGLGAKIGIGAAFFLAGILWLWWEDKKSDLKLQGQLEYVQKELKRQDSLQAIKDSTQMAALERVNAQLNLSLGSTERAITVFRNTTGRVVVPGQLDSVYLDTAFAKLADTLKIQVLRALGNQVASECELLRDTCRKFRDSAYRALATKDEWLKIRDDRIKTLEELFKNKPRRSCGLGGTAGVIGGYDPWRKEAVKGLGGAAGLTCSF